MAGVAGLTFSNKINGCDSKPVKMYPSETAGNPRECRTVTDFTETRSMLKKAAMAEPGNTPARCCHYNMLEQTENLSKPARPDEWPHRRRHLAASLEQQQRRLIEYRNRNAGE